jgi:hypothetical protein
LSSRPGETLLSDERQLLPKKDADLSLDDFSGTGPSLDNKALQEYRKRIEDL